MVWFGAVDAAAAVASAASYSTGSLGSSSSTAWNDDSAVSETLPDLTLKTYDIVESGAGTIEWVWVAVKLSHAVPNHLGIRLESPAGTVSTLLTPLTRNNGNPAGGWMHLPTNAFYGESKAGTRKLHIADHVSGTTGTFNQWSISFRQR